MSVVKQLTLREAREKRKLTQLALEEKSGVAQGVISAIERGDVKDPNASTLLKLAAALDVDPRTLKFGATDQVNA
jgi:transcriptional regulator with XRE-family HTH domain